MVTKTVTDEGLLRKAACPLLWPCAAAAAASIGMNFLLAAAPWAYHFNLTSANVT